MTELLTEIWIQWIILANYLGNNPSIVPKILVIGTIVVLIATQLRKGLDRGICKS
jgi:hypothetical protein